MAKTMRAAVFAEFGGPEVVELTKVSLPEPGPGQVRLKVEASAMNHLDLWVRRGLPIETPMPHIGGADIAGVVEAVGPGVDGVPLGTRVVVDPSIGYDVYFGQDQGESFGASALRLIGEHTQGGFAEFAVVPASNLLELPKEYSAEQATAAGLVFTTAWRSLIDRGRVRPGERVLITGASGGVGTAAVQIAARAGAKVYAVTSGSRKARMVQDLGAEIVYDRTAVDFSREAWRDTGKRGIDLIFDTVGESVWSNCLRALAPGGRLVTAGATTGSHGVTEIRLVFWKQLSIVGSTMGTPDQFRQAMRQVFAGTLRPVIHEVLPLAETRRAHEILESGQVFGKLVIVP